MKSALAAFVILLVAHASFAEEPKGFADVTWGTKREDVVEKFIKIKCSRTASQPHPRGDILICAEYRLMEEWPRVEVHLSFGRDDRLNGYDLVAGFLYREFREAVIAKFGPPKVVTDYENRNPLDRRNDSDEEPLDFWSGKKWQAEWGWPSGTSATLIEYVQRNPFGGSTKPLTTLTVRTKASTERARERLDQIKRGF